MNNYKVYHVTKGGNKVCVGSINAKGETEALVYARDEGATEVWLESLMSPRVGMSEDDWKQHVEGISSGDGDFVFVRQQG